jgi:hypothetical protein
MATNIELAKSALKAARIGWYRYLTSLWLVILFLAIDSLTDQKFLSDDLTGYISFYGLEIPRIAFSFTYSALFGAFAIWAAGSAKTTLDIVTPLGDQNLLKDLQVSPEYRLWELSPVHKTAINTIIFWLLSASGLSLLLCITVVHLGNFNPPPREIMSEEHYQLIGVFCAAILALSVRLTLTSIYPAWNNIRGLLSEGKEN